MTARVDILLTATDERRLSQLLKTKAGELDPRALELLEGELARAKVVDSSEIPPNVVAMNSVVSFEDLETGARSEVTLVYPSRDFGFPGAGVDPGADRCRVAWTLGRRFD